MSRRGRWCTDPGASPRNRGGARVKRRCSSQTSAAGGARPCAWDAATAGNSKSADDEYSKAAERDPKVLVTTSRDPSSRLTQFVKELKLLFPTSQRINRGAQARPPLAVPSPAQLPAVTAAVAVVLSMQALTHPRLVPRRC